MLQKIKVFTKYIPLYDFIKANKKNQVMCQ